MRKDQFDPEDITKQDMTDLADAIQEYKEILMSVMVIPDEIADKCRDTIKESMRRTDKLIKKLRKGDKSVFKDEDELNEMY
ncbi:MAG: hypothetical protein NC131_10265 [Roseburia sp.]|nr:hypothetical protein [Roseburia sp.]